MKNVLSGVQNSLRRRSDTELLAIGCLLIFVIRLIPVPFLSQPIILDDEFGYWGSAAYFAGYNWSSAVSRIAYYSFGYSFLLMPLFHFFSTFASIYKAAVVLNDLLLTAILPMAWSLARRYFPSLSRWARLAACMLVAVCPAYLTQGGVAWAESLLYFLFWLILWLFDRFERDTPLWRFCFTGALLVYLFAVHQRSIAVLAAAAVVVPVMALKKHISLKQLLFFFLGIGITLLIFAAVKHQVKTYLWLNSPQSAGNDFAANLTRVAPLFTSKGMLQFLCNLCGQVFYLGAASFLMAYFGVFRLFRDSAACLRGGQKLLPPQKNGAARPAFSALFLLLSLTLLIVEGSAYFLAPTRADHVFYGRYNDLLSGPIFLYGLLWLFSKVRRRGRARELLLAAALLLATGAVAVADVLALKLKGYNLFCAPVFALTRSKDLTALCINTGVILILSALLWLTFAKIGGNRLKAAALALCFAFFFGGGALMMSRIVRGQYSAWRSVAVVENIQKRPGGLPVYFYLEGAFKVDKAHVQMAMFWRPLICADDAYMQEHASVKKLVVVEGMSADSFKKLYAGQYRRVYCNARYQLWVSR